MNKKVVDFYSILTEEKDNIGKFSKIIKASDELAKRMNIVISEMNSIKQDMIMLEENINKERVRTEEIEDKINDIRINEVKDNINGIVEILVHNLPKDIKAEFNKEYCDEFDKQVVDLMKFNNIIGEIIIYNDDNELKVDVKLWEGQEKFQQFIIKEKYRIFKIISFINTSLSYDE
ncbi:hypothetical protein [Clostridium taeniosporum]|uniref:Uncharacterized protein n=1 Tax=Clostridium taeniosporum TaxID=394958 RepID=A0A1D7XLH1_9CLOT|nr:hypothetical protein [Clostridium taeniosporum]AOR24171.1 hypothetical protein BGI42_10710 [Clostridium taeniosporum]